MNPNSLLDLARNATGSNDSELAEMIGIARQTLSNFRKDRRPIPDKLIIALARLAELDPAQTIAEIHAHQAADHQEEVKAVWLEVAKRAAVAVVAAATLGQGNAAPLSMGTGINPTESVYYVKSKNRIWSRRKTTRLWSWFSPLQHAA